MEISKKNYMLLLLAFVMLICIMFGLMYQYNKERNEAVAEIEKEGYVCTKNYFGFYKSCFKPKKIEEIEWNIMGDIKWQNISE